MRSCHCRGIAVFVIAAITAMMAHAQSPLPKDARTEALAKEIAAKGWIVFSAKADNGTWDLFLMRPDGSQRRNITNTADYEEAAPRFSPDGQQLLYRRLAKGTTINHDQWGFQGCLMIARANGADAVAAGQETELPWASWSPDGKQIVCLTKKTIQIVDLATHAVVREIPRKGIYQQLFWSLDGKSFCGTANHAGESWTVVCMNAQTGDVIPLRSFQNCTPDWHPDSKHVILSSRPANQTGANGYGYTQLWQVDIEGKDQQLLYGEDGCHIYGGGASPDGAYIYFTRGDKDGSGAEKAGAPICIMRAADAPSIGGESVELRKLHLATKDGPVLQLDLGWEPHWTYTEIGE